jgi:transposase InsO family protein
MTGLGAPSRRSFVSASGGSLRCGSATATGGSGSCFARKVGRSTSSVVHRLYKLEGLAQRHKPPRRRVATNVRDKRSAATGPNQIWAMDWMYDQFFDGRRIWVLTVVDTWSRICPVLRACRTATALEVTAALDEAMSRFGAP